MSDSTIVYLTLGAIVALMVWNRLPVGLVALGGALVLGLTGVISYTQVSAGFGDPVVLMIATLFVVSEALDMTGVTAWVGGRVVQLGRGQSRRTLVWLMLLAAVLSSLISVSGAVAALVPMTVLVAMRTSEPSLMLLPLAFAAHAGSMLALTGTPVNILVSDELASLGEGRFGFLEFGIVGAPLLVGTILITMLIGPHVLPRGRTASTLADFSEYGDTLAEQYLAAGAGPVFDERGAPLPEPDELVTREHGVAEVVVRPRSRLIGETTFAGMVTDSQRFVVLAVQRAGEDMLDNGCSVQLAAGDLILLHGTWSELESNIEDDGDVLVVNHADAVRRSAVPLGQGSRRAIAVLVVMVALLVSGVLPAAIVTLLATIALVLLRVMSAEQVYTSINWPTVTLIAGMIPVSAAVTSSGAATQLGDLLVDVVGAHGPYALLAGVFVFIAVLGQLISNMATALIIIPIALAAAGDMAVAPAPVLMCVTVAAAASFLTPVATPGNLMVKGPGGYEFGDYWPLGLPLLLWFGVVAVFGVPIIWQF